MIATQATETKNWRFQVDLEKIGWLTIDTPGASVNTLSREAIMELETLVSRIEDLAGSGEVSVSCCSRARTAASSPAPMSANSTR